MNLHWLFAFGLTQVIEGPIYYYALGSDRALSTGVPAPPARPPVERVLLALLPSALTHPMLWFALFPPLYRAMGYWPSVVASEVVVWLVEAAILHALTRRSIPRALSWALGANLASVILGLITSEVFGWP